MWICHVFIPHCVRLYRAKFLLLNYAYKFFDFFVASALNGSLQTFFEFLFFDALKKLVFVFFVFGIT